MDSDRPPAPSAPVIRGSASRRGFAGGSLPMGSIPLTAPREPCGHREAPGNRNTNPARTPASRKVLGPLTESLGLRRPPPQISLRASAAPEPGSGGQAAPPPARRAPPGRAPPEYPEEARAQSHSPRHVRSGPGRACSPNHPYYSRPRRDRTPGPPPPTPP